MARTRQSSRHGPRQHPCRTPSGRPFAGGKQYLSRVGRIYVSLIDGAKLRALRVARGLTQREVSDIIGVSMPTLYEMENDKPRSHNWAYMWALARLLNCGVDDFCRYPIAYGRGVRGAPKGLVVEVAPLDAWCENQGSQPIDQASTLWAVVADEHERTGRRVLVPAEIYARFAGITDLAMTDAIHQALQPYQ